MQEAGKLDPEMAKADMQKRQDMDAKGELEAMFLGLAKDDPKAAPQEEAPAPESRGLMQGAM